MIKVNDSISGKSRLRALLSGWRCILLLSILTGLHLSAGNGWGALTATNRCITVTIPEGHIVEDGGNFTVYSCELGVNITIAATGDYELCTSSVGIIVPGIDHTAKATMDCEDEDEEPCDSTITLVVLIIDTETVSLAVADQTRKRVGVGEEVELWLKPSSLGPITWSIVGEGTLEFDEFSAFFTAHDRASTPTITATYETAKCNVTFDVVEPSGITFVKATSLNGDYTAGQAGTGMTCDLTFNPTNVSFYRVQWFEDPGPASNVHGYFAQNPPFTAARLGHEPHPKWKTLYGLNEGSDTASYTESIPNGAGGFPAWSDGGWDWDIPTRYRVLGATGASAAGYVFQNTTQTFRIQTNGDTTVTKQGDGAAASISRSP